VIVAPLAAVAAAWPIGMLVAVGLFGLIIGSFLNVVIARVPAGRSLWRPRSACPKCNAQLAWHDNVPVLSFLLLRGRCRSCRTPISWRYPIVEIANAAALVSAYVAFGPTAEFLVAGALLSALIVVMAIDLQLQLIPDVITIPGIVVGLLANIVTGHVPWLESLIGLVGAGGLFLMIILVSGGGMGGGDMKLAAMLGAFLGWKALLVALFVAIVLGGVVAIALLTLRLRRRKDPVPFGPFLAVGGAMGLFWGTRVFAWYAGGFGL
jgi:leader peptidase (prepilin peptidase) / N-methyltransferase